ncbi:helix-turn-helix transcriptional regulator [Promicromonospora sp. NPDC019610]|uniref:helix-turn-helix transcriptional regulator n=1 Tax=Promicromonospora sp. NPDC019610 TaxID=3364405 RepID=UPI0037AD66FB
MAIDRVGLAEFLRQRRESLQPENVGLPRGRRRRTSGLRREEVATLCHMSADYYARLERGRGHQPSKLMITAIAQGLRLTSAEHDHLLRLAGHNPPARDADGGPITPGLLGILDSLKDTPAEIVTELGETLRQSPLGTALTGDRTRYTGPARSIGFRWFTDPTARQLYHPDDHPLLTRRFTASLRQVIALRGPDSRAAQLADLLLGRSEEFREVWNSHDVSAPPVAVKRFVHPEVGILELTCQTLLDPDRSHRLLVFAAAPRSESYEKLRQLAGPRTPR